MCLQSIYTQVKRLLPRTRSLLRSVLSVSVVLVCACSKNDEDPIDNQLVNVLTVAFPPGSGFSGAGYDDTILKAVCEAQAQHHEMKVRFLHPKNLTEAQTQLDAWLGDNNDKKALILCGPVYEPFVKNLHPGSGRILLLDSVQTFGEEGISTLQLKRYGGAYLAGAVCASFRNLILIKAFDGDRMMDTVAEGLLDGYSDNGKGDAETLVLANDPSGANMPDQLFNALYTAEEFGFVINNVTLLAPVCGASRMGAYAFSNNYYATVLGIGEDCSAFSDILPLSLVFDLGAIVKDYIGRWLASEPWPAHEDFGISTGHVYLKLNPRYFEIAGTRMFYRSSPCLFSEDQYKAWEAQYKETALEKEASHAY